MKYDCNYSDFDLEMHCKTHVNYLEVIILPSGKIVYSTPSHQEKLISIACEQQNLTRQQLSEKVPLEYYADFLKWLCRETKCVSVWNDFHIGEPNEAQMSSLSKLKEFGAYIGQLEF